MKQFWAKIVQLVMSFTPITLYPNKDPEFALIRQGLLKSQLINTWLCPPLIIAEICGFAAGKFSNCCIDDCNKPIHVVNKFMYDQNTHKNAVQLGYFQNDNNKYFCVQCFYKKKFTICNIYNTNFTVSGPKSPNIKLCSEIILCFNIKLCANTGHCNEQWIQCQNACVTTLISNTCAVCEQMIGNCCLTNNQYTHCTYCQALICESCEFGSLTDINDMICLNCNQHFRVE